MLAKVFRNFGASRAARCNVTACQGSLRHLTGSTQQPLAEAFRQPQAVPAWQHTTKGSIEQWSVLRTAPFRFHDLCAIGADDDKRLRYSTFMRRELCIRFAQSIVELRSLPSGWIDHGPFRAIVDVYDRSIQALEDCPDPQTAIDDQRFVCVLERLLLEQEQTGSVPSILQAVRERAAAIPQHTNDVLMNFFTLRTSLRFMMKHYVQSHRGGAPASSGILQLRCNPAEEAQKAAKESFELCFSSYGQAPPIVIQGDLEETIAHVPRVLQYMLTELFKNACRAVVERHAGSASGEGLPPVVCSIESRTDRLMVKVADEGCGMSKQQMANMWEFLYSSCPQSAWTQAGPQNGQVHWSCPANRQQVVLAGYGVGLPLSRIYARYFGGGDIEASSTEGHGSEFCIVLNRSPSRCEVLP